MCPSIADDEIHVWLIDLRVANGNLGGLCACLSVEEQARAERFRFPRDREAYSICRGALRHILGAYLGVRPGEVKFSLGPHGKPQLNEPNSGTALQFNVSHSQGMALIAVARGMSVGVDIECVRPLPDLESIAGAHFSRKEREDLFRLPVERRIEGFYSCWTRKEAVVKALGGGLSIPLASFSVAMESGGTVELLDEGGNPKETLPWKVMDLRFEEAVSGELYVGALAGVGQSWRANVRKWRPPAPLLPAATGRG